MGVTVLGIQHNFYPRSPCGERLYLVRGQRPNWRISIHALLAESDKERNRNPKAYGLFLSTLSLRRATSVFFIIFNACCTFLSTLSLRRATFNACCTKPIHTFLSTLSLRRATPRGGGLYYLIPNFYPRSPCGERQMLFRQSTQKTVFLSTLSLRRATKSSSE